MGVTTKFTAFNAKYHFNRIGQDFVPIAETSKAVQRVSEFLLICLYNLETAIFPLDFGVGILFIAMQYQCLFAP